MKKKTTPKMALRKTNDLLLAEGLNIFLSEKTALNSAQPTIIYYQRRMKKFMGYLLLVKEKEWLCSEMNEELITDYKRYLQTLDIKEQTIVSEMRGVRAVMYFLMEKGYIQSFKIKMPKATDVIMDTYTEDEIQRLIKKPNTDSFAELRNWAMVCFFIGTGCRLGTAINVKIKDINFSVHQIFLRHTKNKRQYSIPLSPTLEKVLTEYLFHRNGEVEDYLFVNAFGEKMINSTVTTAIKNYNKKRGVKKHSVHLFRHTFARIYTSTEGNAFKLQTLLGHSTMYMTMKYARQFGNDLAKNFSEHSPLELLGDDMLPKSKKQLRK